MKEKNIVYYKCMYEITQSNLNNLLNNNSMDIIINNKYKIESLIGEGSFGKIFKAANIITDEKVAIKIEKKQDRSILKYEANILIRCKEIKGIPRIKSYGVEQNYNYMIIELLGKSLEDLKIENNGKLDLKTVIVIGIEILNILENLHTKGIIHRDLKPENILSSDSATTNYHLIDFGISKYYLDSSGMHKPLISGKKLIGTLRYSSLNVTMGIEASRRDDLESLGYIFIHLLKGALPWESTSGENKEKKYENIVELKQTTSILELCSEIPLEFAVYLTYCRNLNYDSKPDYNYLRTLFTNLLTHINNNDE